MSETRRAPTSAAPATAVAPDPSIPPMDAGERAALLEGRHGNPHQVLGAHEATAAGVRGVVVRVFQPAATAQL